MTAVSDIAGRKSNALPKGTNLVQVMLQGVDLKTCKGRGYLPSFRDAYSDAELAAVAHYVIGHFGGKSGAVTAQAVREQRVAR